jgi:hypothetical protein
MNNGISLISGWASFPAAARIRIIAPVVCIIFAFNLVGTLHAAGRYLKIDYPGSTNANELPTPVTYTLWIPDGLSRLRGMPVQQSAFSVYPEK